MPDITMCKDSECPKAQKCYRFKATPTPYWQSYFAESPRPNVLMDGEAWCGYFWPVKGGRND